MKLHSDTYDNYKKSEGEWAGTVPSEWQEKRVKDLFRMVTQTAPANNDYELLSLYSSIGVRPRKDLEARGNKASSTDGYWMVKKNDIVVNKLLAWMGSVGLSEYDGVTSPAYDVLRQVKPDIDPRYYAYLFRTETAKKVFRKNSRGIMDMRLRLYFDKLGAITVPVPLYEEQIRIADYVDIKTFQVDKKTKHLINKIQLYRKLRQSLISEKISHGLDKPTRMKDSGIEWLGCMPSSWSSIRLKDLIQKLESGVSVNAADYPVESDGVGVLKTSSVGQETFSPEKNKTVWTSEVSRVRIPVKKNCIIISRMNTPKLVGSSAYVNKDYPNLFLPDRLWQTYFFPSVTVSSKWLSWVIGCNQFRFVLSALATGTSPSMKNLGQDKLLSAEIPYPEFTEQTAIAKYLDEKTAHIDNIIFVLKAQIEKLNELRIALINDAVTGKIKVVNEEKSKGQAA